MSYHVHRDCDWLQEPPSATPEERLRLAVFQRAVLDALQYRTRPNDPGAVSAMKYLFEPVDQRWVYSVTAVAEQLEMDVEILREQLRRIFASGAEGKASKFRYSRWSRVAPGQPQSVTANTFKKLVFRLSPEQVEGIRRDYASGEMTQKAVALKYGVSQTAVNHIVRRRHPAAVEG